jgi:hypothetical protein
MPMNSLEEPVNRLTSSHTDKVTHTPAYKETSVQLKVLGETGDNPLPRTNSRFGHPTPQKGVEVEAEGRKWKRKLDCWQQRGYSRQDAWDPSIRRCCNASPRQPRKRSACYQKPVIEPPGLLSLLEPVPPQGTAPKHRPHQQVSGNSRQSDQIARELQIILDCIERSSPGGDVCQTRIAGDSQQRAF